MVVCFTETIEIILSSQRLKNNVFGAETSEIKFSHQVRDNNDLIEKSRLLNDDKVITYEHLHGFQFKIPEILQ